MAASRMEAFTEQNFMDGEPVELTQATERPLIYAMWPHGNEINLGPRVGHALYAQRPDLLDHVDYECGNPRAVSERVAKGMPDRLTGRYSEGGTDLNRSFDPSIEPTSYEQHRARQILGKINNQQYDYVLDLHTSTTDIDRCLLVSEAHFNAARKIIEASPVPRIIVLPHEIAVAGLIGNVRQSVSVEYNRGVALAKGVGETLETIDGLVSGQPQYKGMERQVFRDIVHIPKTDDPGADAHNYELTPNGYYPVLYGENSYRADPTKPYLGFGARAKITMDI